MKEDGVKYKNAYKESVESSLVTNLSSSISKLPLSKWLKSKDKLCLNQKRSQLRIVFQTLLFLILCVLFICWYFCIIFTSFFYFSERLRIWQLQVKFNLTGRVMNEKWEKPKVENWKMAAGSQVAKNKAFYGHKTEFELWLFFYIYIEAAHSIWIFIGRFSIGKMQISEDDNPKLMTTINNYCIIEID